MMPDDMTPYEDHSAKIPAAPQPEPMPAKPEGSWYDVLDWPKAVVAVVIILCVTAVVLFEMRPDPDPLPNCAEDEVLVPNEHPYTVADLRCVHVEDVR